MRKLRFAMGMLLACFATVGIAGIPTSEKVTCPIGGKTFTITGTGSCTRFGGSQDFLLRVDTSCDFVTKLPQCPDNGLALYKEFTPAEVKLLNDHVKSAEFQAMTRRSPFHVGKNIDDFLVANGSTPAFDFWYLLGGLQYEREATLSDPEYLGWFKSAGDASLAKASKEDAPMIRLLLAYVHYHAADFAAATTQLDAVKSDASLGDNKFVQSYLKRLETCVAAKDAKLCAPDEKVLPREKP